MEWMEVKTDPYVIEENKRYDFYYWGWTDYLFVIKKFLFYFIQFLFLIFFFKN